MSEELIKCPNCNGSLIVKNNKKECPYCGAEFVIKQENPPAPQQKQNEDSNLSIAERWFELVNVQKSYANEKIWHTLETTLININKELELAIYYNYFQKLAKSNTWLAAFEVNRELMFKIKKRLQALLYDNEELFYYRDTGIISKGKSGILYTNMRIFFLTKSSTVFINYSDINSLYTGDFGTNQNNWYINKDSRCCLDTININDGNLAAEIAYICTGVKNLQERMGNPNFKIKIEFLRN